MHDWRWWFETDAGWIRRIAFGVAFFLCLAIWDLARRGREARRWREYLFLLLATAAGIAYGALNDYITSSISWEYYYYGKGLASVLGSRTPPYAGPLHWEAIKIGMRAAGSAGVLSGALLLMANNPKPGRPPVSWKRMVGELCLAWLVTALCAVILGIVGSQGGCVWTTELREVVEGNYLRPRHFLSAYGAHAGGYAGGVLGSIIAIVRIQFARKRLRIEQASSA